MSCSICIEDYTDTSHTGKYHIAALPCIYFNLLWSQISQTSWHETCLGNHWFHASCITKWLDKNDTCPHCRQKTARHTMRFMPTDVAKGFVREGSVETDDNSNFDDELRKSLESLQNRLERIEDDNDTMKNEYIYASVPRAPDSLIFNHYRLRIALAERDRFAEDNERKATEHETLKRSHSLTKQESNKWKMEHKRLQSTNSTYQTELVDLKVANYTLQLENQRLNATTRSAILNVCAFNGF